MLQIYLAIVDLLLHRPLSKESIDVTGLLLSKPIKHSEILRIRSSKQGRETESHVPIDAEDALDIVRGVPGRVKDDNAVGCHQVNAQTAGASRDKEQASPQVGRTVESIAPLLAVLRGRLSIQTEIICVLAPGANLFQFLLSKLLAAPKMLDNTFKI